MVEEIYRRGSSYRSPSVYQIRQQKKKALQSYKHISTIKAKSDKEAEESKGEAEAYLKKFITSSGNYGK